MLRVVAPVEQLGYRGRGAVVLAEHRQAGGGVEHRGEVGFVPGAEACLEGFALYVQLAQPRPEVIGLRHADSQQALLLARVQPGAHRLDIAPHQFQRLLGMGQDQLVRMAGEQLAGEVHHHGLNAAAVEPHADAECAFGLEPDQAGGLPALALGAAAGLLDQAFVGQGLHDAADRGVGQLRHPRQIGFRRFAGAAQRQQQRAFVVQAQAGGIHATACLGCGHLVSVLWPALVGRRLGIN
ncbi:hypothetical protein D9M72_309000 [compost metagenome]